MSLIFLFFLQRDKTRIIVSGASDSSRPPPIFTSTMYSTSFEKETDPDSSIKTYLKAIARWGRRPLSNNF